MDSKKSYPWSLQSRISKLLQDEATSDTEFLIGKPPERYLCHKVILAAGSPVFETMFYGAIKQKSPVCVPDVTAKGFSLMLQYLYSDSVSIQDESDAFEAAYSAKKYMIKSLFTICENFLIKNTVLSTDNIFTIYEAASFLEMKKLQDCGLRYISRNAKELFLSESFLKISKKTCLDILSLDLMNIESEMEIILSLWLWGKQQCKEKGVKCTSENIREHTKDFLKHIRFLAMNMEELIIILKKCQILDTSDELAILWNFAMPSTPNHIPSSISTETSTRSLWNCKSISFPSQYQYDCSMAAFLIENSQTDIEISVTGSPVTIIGVIISFKPIPCYSHEDRSLEIEIHAFNYTSPGQTFVKSSFKATDVNNNEEQRKMILFDDYIVVEEEKDLLLTIITFAEGIRLMRCREEAVHHDLVKSKICFKFDHRKNKNKILSPVKELMIM